MRSTLALALMVVAFTPAAAQEQEDFTAEFAKVAGGAVYDEKIGIDGSLVSEAYQLTHLTCSAGSRKIRLLMPVGRDAAEAEGTTLRQVKGQWQIDIRAFAKTYRKDVTFKPVRDPISQYDEQAEITLQAGDPLWKALLAERGDSFTALVGNLGTYVSILGGKEFQKFRKACGINP